MDTFKQIETMGVLAKKASRLMASASSISKVNSLNFAADAINENRDKIIIANRIDMKEAKEKGLSSALLDRLMINDTRLTELVSSIRNIANQEDPIGKILSEWT